MSLRERKLTSTFEPLLRVAAMFAATGGLLFVWVWWPIQAERNLLKLRKIEAQVFQKKSELNILNERYASLTSLAVLDQWAKRHGPWVPASTDNVIPIE